MKNNLLRKIGALALVLVLSIGTATTAFANEVNEMENVADATIQYNVTGTYTIQIPEYIDVTAPTSLYASELNISPDSYISVELTNVPENGVYTLNHTTGADSIDITFSGDFGMVTPSQLVLAKFDGNSEYSTSFYSTITEASASTTHKAGAYTGTARFNFMIYFN